MAAETGHLELAYDYFAEAALMDLHDLEHNTRDGVHIASLAGAWTAAVAGFGGMRDHEGKLTFAPRLPARLTRLRFRLVFRGQRLHVDVTKRDATYTLLDGDRLHVAHHRRPLELAAGSPVTEPIPPLAERPRPNQPPGREPARRAPEGSA
jgi:alpha,alpha-trehalose phosphorylase